MNENSQQAAAPAGGPAVTDVGGVWIVRLERAGKAQEYRCTTEAQARRLAEAMRHAGPVRRLGR